ncbi:hypothetical protein GTCCBUS3UF5_18920 [Geobacillus thermoleovorans CCB_US3_UF5]|uniref:Uncharacterized protein n=2 Tax=Geobacillus TaxID=129337 RepID=A0A7U9P4I7_GEOTM|nr:hypothetical protein GTCCBUS3UF5_18920 [Geobacillus thermoleovorans CCB_US3_UF5]ESU70440.1 hypothetical protein T260_19105 [Geobacillus sp. MAS1]GAJ59001.1 hypothetical protein B23_2225 [Geobacillus thermoleovorans B23]
MLDFSLSNGYDEESVIRLPRDHRKPCRCRSWSWRGFFVVRCPLDKFTLAPPRSGKDG